METEQSSSNKASLFSDWSQFHLETNGLMLDVSHFTVRDYGFSKQPMIEAVVYCPVGQLETAWVMWQKASLVITKGLTTQYFHGVIVYEGTILRSHAPKGYIASTVRIASNFWWLANTLTHCTLHRTNVSEFIDALAEASGLPALMFTKHYLPNDVKALRMASGRRWVDFISDELNKDKVSTRSLFDDNSETIEFIGDINKVHNVNDESRQVLSIAKSDITQQMHNVYYEFTEKHHRIKGGIISRYEISSADARAYPGEWLRLEGDLYQVSNVNITGKHAYTFDNGVASRIAAPELSSLIEIRKPNSEHAYKIKEEKKAGFSVHTGHIETKAAGGQSIERDGQGHYSARFDEDAPCGARHSKHLNKVLTAPPGQALNHLRNASLMGGENHTTDFPLRDGAEELLLKTGNDDEPVVILGALNNARSKPVGKQSTGGLRTASGNQLTFVDAGSDASIALETYKQYNSLRFANKNNAIRLTSQKGNIKLDASKNYLSQTPATIHLQTKRNLTEFINEDVNLDNFGGRIKFNIKNRAYLSALESYKIEVRKVMIKSLDTITLKADDVVNINCEELILNANNGRVEPQRSPHI